MSDKAQLTVSGIKNDLDQGLSRPEIQAKYGLSTRDLKSVFSHPKLKGLKTKPVPQFVLVDDEEADVIVATPEAVAPEPTPTVTEVEAEAPLMSNEF